MDPLTKAQADELARYLTKKRAISRSCIYYLERDLGLDRARDFDRARELVEDLVNDLDVAFKLAGFINHDPDLADSRDSDCAIELVAALARSCEYVQELDDDVEFIDALGRAYIRPLARYLEHCATIVGNLDRAPDVQSTIFPVRSAQRSNYRQPGGATLALVATFCRFLQSDQRARYRAEFHSELCDISGRRRRLAYVFQILRSTPAIRAGIQATLALESEVSS